MKKSKDRILGTAHALVLLTETHTAHCVYGNHVPEPVRRHDESRVGVLQAESNVTERVRSSENMD